MQQAGRSAIGDDPHALLLDFAKAFDPLSREFLVEALRNAGLPPRFVAAVRNLHDGTSCCLLVNGYMSRSVYVIRGIRQGCTLAPTLFTVSLDVLYTPMESSAQVRCIGIRAGENSLELKVCGYADDTALYVADRDSAAMHWPSSRDSAQRPDSRSTQANQWPSRSSFLELVDRQLWALHST